MEILIDLKENAYGEIEGKAYFSYYDNYIKVTFDKELEREVVEENINSLNRDFHKFIDKLCEGSFRFCKDMVKNYPEVDYAEGLVKLHDYKKIVKYMKFTSIKVDEVDSYNLSGECDWDKENGIQWIMDKENVLYVGPWDDLDITYDLEEYNNYAL